MISAQTSVMGGRCGKYEFVKEPEINTIMITNLPYNFPVSVYSMTVLGKHVMVLVSKIMRVILC